MSGLARVNGSLQITQASNLRDLPLCALRNVSSQVTINGPLLCCQEISDIVSRVKAPVFNLMGPQGTAGCDPTCSLQLNQTCQCPSVGCGSRGGYCVTNATLIPVYGAGTL